MLDLNKLFLTNWRGLPKEWVRSDLYKLYKPFEQLIVNIRLNSANPKTASESTNTRDGFTRT